MLTMMTLQACQNNKLTQYADAFALPELPVTKLLYWPIFIAMKLFNLVFCVLFVLFAALQYNDPDPYIWMPIYLYSAALCYQASQKRFYPKAYVLGIIVYGVYATFLFFDKTGVLDWVKEHHHESMVQTMKATKPWIEESREFFGLMILIAVIGINWVHMKRVASR